MNIFMQSNKNTDAWLGNTWQIAQTLMATPETATVYNSYSGPELS